MDDLNDFSASELEFGILWFYALVCLLFIYESKTFFRGLILDEDSVDWNLLYCEMLFPLEHSLVSVIKYNSNELSSTCITSLFYICATFWNVRIDGTSMMTSPLRCLLMYIKYSDLNILVMVYFYVCFTMQRYWLSKMEFLYIYINI